MNLTLEQEGRLKVTLSREDLGRFHMTYDQLDYANEATRGMMAALLRSAREVLGFDPGAGRLLIEVFPAPGEGCTVLFTKLSESGENSQRLRLRHAAGRRPTVFCFEDSGSLLDAIQHLKTACPMPGESSLYALAGGYRLVLFLKEEQQRSTRLLLQEYGREMPTDRTHLAYLQEHGTLLCGFHAVEQIGRFLSS